jgi:hypothetical protein
VAAKVGAELIGYIGDSGSAFLIVSKISGVGRVRANSRKPVSSPGT